MEGLHQESKILLEGIFQGDIFYSLRVKGIFFNHCHFLGAKDRKRDTEHRTEKESGYKEGKIG